ncbi:hypothetical protein C2845_PM02G36020 [Panicum miliaceum]|uniref:DUF1618 domain-containing protein n=1 Tax=Panicum miliaceum TaxID=4540 RepID=A0A3L6SDC3_PANMI|nr:hypothetical protein C2845_PM02G36020 [Panicum miliaceum]
MVITVPLRLNLAWHGSGQFPGQAVAHQHGILPEQWPAGSGGHGDAGVDATETVARSMMGNRWSPDGTAQTKTSPNLIRPKSASASSPQAAPAPQWRRPSQQRASPKCFRDLTCTYGVIKFIEMEHRIIVREIRDISAQKPCDPSLRDVLYDSDLIMLQKRKDVDIKTKKLQLMDGWRAVMWARVIESDCWFKERAVGVDDILVDDSTYSVLLSGQRDESLGSLTFRSMYSAWPTLSMGGDDLLYLSSSLKLCGQNGWVVAVDLVKKALKAFGACSQVYRPCTLSNHLNMNLGHC